MNDAEVTESSMPFTHRVTVDVNSKVSVADALREALEQAEKSSTASTAGHAMQVRSKRK